MRHQHLLWFFFLLLTVPSLAQEILNCSEFVQTALEQVQTACEETYRNEVCYGNDLLEATAHESVTDFVFEQAGDIEDVNNLSSMQVGNLNVESGIWGIALFRIQANLPETLPGQNVTMLVIGDVYIENQSTVETQINLKTQAGVNVRRQPSTVQNNVIRSLGAGQDVIATGRLADGSWIRVTDSDQSSGWISAEFLEGDVSQLPIVENDASINYGAMQAFYLQSSITGESCEVTPTDGVLIQTPKGVTRINFLINGVRVTLGSTVYVQARPDEYLYITVLDGTAILSANGVSQTVPAGAIGRVPLGDDGLISGTPEFPQGYTLQDSFDLLLDLLSEPIEIAAPLLATNIQEAIDDANESTSTTSNTPSGDIADGLPPSGRWQRTSTVIANTCDPERIPVGTVHRSVTTVTFQADRSSLTWDFHFDDWLFNAGRIGDNLYAYSAFNGLTGTITFTSSTTFVATHRGDYGGCIYYEDFEGQFIGG